MSEQTIYVLGFGPNQADLPVHYQITQLVMTDVQALRLAKLLLEALEVVDEDGRIRLTMRHGGIREGIDLARIPEDGVITDAPRRL